MSKGVHVESLRALEDLRVSLARFASESAEALKSVERTARRTLELLDDRYRESQHEVMQCQEEYHSADPEEDDVSYLGYKLQQAEQHLQLVRYWRQRAEESAGDYVRYARRLQDFSEKRSVAACAFLEQRVSELEGYISVQPQVESALGSLTGNSGYAQANSLARITEFALPTGFKWVRLDEISPSEISRLPDASDFIKVSYEQVKRGLEILLNEVLPAIARHGSTADSDFFAEHDRQSGSESTVGAQTIHQAFFGRARPEHVRVERFEGDSHYEITNGRHRIKVALDSGWPAIPSEVVEVPRRK